MTTRNVTAILDDLLDVNETVSSAELAAAAKVSRQAAHRALHAGVAEGRLLSEGAARATRYRRTEPRFVYRRAGLAEDRVWEELSTKVPALAKLQGKDRRLVAYAFAEMVNNAIDHSAGSRVSVTVRVDGARLSFCVEDNGIGAFEHFRRYKKLAGALEALQEISKGKATADPARHTGEGLFFTSKAASRFELHSGSLRWIVDNERGDSAVVAAPRRVGTAVTVTVALPVKRSLAELFAEYTEDHQFTRTRTVVKLFAVGVEFVSRSEARRLLHGLERFREVILDFQGVEGIGQGFADEVFRVWAKAHPEVLLTPVNMNDEVDFMVRRGIGGAGDQS